jgi:hypothetical protein
VKLVAAAALTAVVTVAAVCGGRETSVAYRAATPNQAKQLMIDYLQSKQLAWRWVACLHTGRSFVGAPIVRCNVNFGDPHIEAYCVVLRWGQLYTDHQDANIPCQRDNRAPPATIVTS